MSFTLWITGLPGSGKSTVASKLKEKKPGTVILRMDELRKTVTPEPDYSDSEREHVYRALVYTAKKLSEQGHNIIIDATGNRQSWRTLARDMIDNFYEVYLTCPLELCIKREKTRLDSQGAPKDIYKQSNAGAPVPGVNVPYEKPDIPELTIDTEKESPEEAAVKILNMIEKQGRVLNRPLQ